MKKKIQVKDIARELGVSPSAVSLALNDRVGVSSELRSRVKGMAAKVGYIKSSIASKSNYIAIVYARAGGHIISEIDYGITSVLKQFGYFEIRYTFVVEEFLNNKNLQAYFERITHENSVSGLLVVFLNITDIQVSILKRNKIPVVLLNSSCNYGLNINIDDVKGGYIAARKLIKLGHTRIGMIVPNIWYDTVWNKRINGYKKALIEVGLKYDPDFIEQENTFNIDESGKATLELLKRHPKITGIIYASDLQAFGGMKIMLENKIKIPEDVSVIGFDNMKFCELFKPALSSMEIPFKTMGRMGAEKLLQSIKGETLKNRTINLAPKLIMRESCRKIK